MDNSTTVAHCQERFSYRANRKGAEGRGDRADACEARVDSSFSDLVHSTQLGGVVTYGYLMDRVVWPEKERVVCPISLTAH